MAGIGNFFKKREKVKIGNEEVGYIVIDAALKETHGRKATVTKNQVEDGSDISDHYRLENEMLSMEAIISEAPIDLIVSSTNVASSFVAGQIGGLGGIATKSLRGIISENVLLNSTDRQLDNLKKIEEFMQNATVFNVVTSLKTYKSMVFGSVTMPKEASIGDSLKLSIQFEQIKIVKSKLVKLTEQVVKGVQAHSAASKQDLGKQKKIEPTEQEAERSSSVLSRLTGIGI